MLFIPRTVRLILHLLTGLLIAAALHIVGRPVAPAPVARWWLRGLLQVFGIRVRVEGAPIDGPAVRVANHVSWLDIALIGAAAPTRFVAKSEVAHWPLAGWLADAAGSFYIRRGRGGATPLLDQLVPHLHRGGEFCFFPEGTTTEGPLPGPFHARLFAAAIEADCHVQPVALSYGRSPDGRDIAPFVGEDSLFAHILRLLRAGPIEARVQFGRPIPPTGTRDELAQAAHATICRALRSAPIPAGEVIPVLGTSA